MYSPISKDIKKLIVKKYIGKYISLAELEKLQRWQDERSENNAVIERLSNQKYIDKHIGILMDIDIDKSWKEVRPKPYHLLWYNKVHRYAAVGVLLIGIAFIMVYMQNVTPEQSYIAEEKSENITIDKSKAILVLSNGKTIDLENKQDLVIDTDNSSLHVNAQRQIIYHNKSKKQNASSSEKWHTIKVPRGGEYKLVLNDSTQVWLNSESELKYPVNFIHDQRIVYLKGEAYFDVSHNDKPFIVSSYHQKVKVYGTEFNINTYDSELITTALVEGVVSVSCNGSAEIKMQAGELAFSTQEKVDIKKSNLKPYIAWKDGEFIFINESLQSIATKLSRWYDVEFVFLSEEMKQYHFTCHLKRYSELKDLLFFFERTLDIHFIQEGDIVRVTE